MGFLLHVVIFFFTTKMGIEAKRETKARIPEVVVICFNNSGPVWRA